MLSAVLLKDINLQTSSGFGEDYNQVLVVGDTAFFAATNGDAGVELWKTDGTAAGTCMVKDIVAGPESSNPDSFVDVDGTLFFTASNGAGGRALWKSDGSEAGTVQVKDLSGDSGMTRIYAPAVLDGILFFQNWDTVSGWQLYRTDGTSDGTQLVMNAPAGFDYPVYPVAFNGRLFYSATDEEHGWEVWSTDGSIGGARLLKDLVPGMTGSSPDGFTVIDDSLYFAAEDGAGGRDLWISDGTSLGTSVLAHFDAQLSSNSLRVSGLTGVGGQAFFSLDDGYDLHQLWKTDGTAAGTVLVTDLPFAVNDSPSALAEVGGVLYFSTYNDESYGGDIWKSDGTADGTMLLKDALSWPEAMPDSLQSLNGKLYFTPEEWMGEGLWTSDGSPEGTVAVKSFTGGNGPLSLLPNGLLLFRANDSLHGEELWISDGSSERTVLLKDINTHAEAGKGPVGFSNLNGIAVFQDDDGLTGSELWVSDGTQAGTRLLKDIWPGPEGSYPDHFTRIGRTLFFSAWDPVHQDAIWKTDGTSEGTVLVADVRPDADGAFIDSLTAVGGTLYFTADDGVHGTELWKSDGTAAGTVLVTDITPGEASSYPSDLTPLGTRLLFFAHNDDYTFRIWVTDGTEVGTHSLSDVPLKVGFNGGPVVVNGIAYFANTNDPAGVQLWRTDGTDAGTMLFRQFLGGDGHSAVTDLTSFNGSLYFVAFDEEHTFSVWRSDGTEAGTVPIWISDPVGGGMPGEMVATDNTMYFLAHGDLWKTDGTEGGAVLVRDFPEGGSGYSPQMHVPVSIGQNLYFMAYDPDTGYELWRSDGTTDGTFRVSDTLPGPGDGSPSYLTNIGGKLFFAAADGVHGTEPWIIAPPTADAGGPYALPFKSPGITMDASGSRDQDPAEKISYAWDLDGDGIYGETGDAARYGDEIGPNPKFSPVIATPIGGDSIPEPLSFAVSVRAANSAGLSSVASTTVTVTDVPVLLFGTANADSFTFRLDASGRFIEFFRNIPSSAAPTYRLPVASIGSIRLSGRAQIPNGSDSAIDTLVIDPSNGDPCAAVRISITSGQLALAPATGDVLFSDLAVATGASLDIGSASIILTQSTYAAARTLINSGRLLSPTAPDTGLAAVQVAQGIGIKRALNGDANFDGRIDADDYFRIDRGNASRLTAPAYQDGDFNLDGAITGEDYALIDAAHINTRRTAVAPAKAAAGACSAPAKARGAAAVRHHKKPRHQATKRRHA